MTKWCIALALLFLSCVNGQDTIKIKGSDTEVNLTVVLAEEYYKHNNQVTISVSGGGSGMGIASLVNGNADIANSSRRIKDSELAQFKNKKIDLDSLIFAIDAIAFIVSDKLSFDSLTIPEVGKILSGTISNWGQLGQNPKPITIYGRQSNSGTYDYIKEALRISFSPHARQMNGNAQIIDAVKSDDSGFGYVSVGYIKKGKISGIKVLSISQVNQEAVSPTDSAAIAKGRYYFQRPLFQYFRKSDFKKINPFLEYVQSKEGKRLINQAGYYPINH